MRIFRFKLYSFLNSFIPLGIYMLSQAIFRFDAKAAYLVPSIVLLAFQIASLVLMRISLDGIKQNMTHSKGKIVALKRDKHSASNFILSNIMPMTIFNFEVVETVVVVALVVGIVAVLYFKNNSYAYNPFLQILGYALFDVEIDTEAGKREGMAIVDRKLVLTYAQIEFTELEDSNLIIWNK